MRQHLCQIAIWPGLFSDPLIEAKLRGKVRVKGAKDDED